MTEYNFTMFSGDDKSLTFNVTDSAGVPVAIAGALLRWAISRSPSASVPMLIRRSDDIDPKVRVIGLAKLQIDIIQDDTENLRGALYHELEITMPDGKVATPLHGTIDVLPDLIHKP